MSETLSFDTILQHGRPVELPSGNSPLVSPVYHSSKFTFERFADLEALLAGQQPGFLYSRVQNPTVLELEQQLARLQGAEAGLALASGVAAISNTLLSLLKNGDHAVIFNQSYRPVRKIFSTLLSKFGISFDRVDMEDRHALEAAIIPGRTRLILFESPSNPQLTIADIGAICRIARQYDLMTILDNTFAGLHNHQDFDIDLYIHSLSKYVIGHGDAIGGAVLGSAPLIEKIRSDAIELGACLDPGAANLALRGLKTYKLRYDLQSTHAMQLARWLAQQPFAHNVRYPGLESHPQHRLASRQQKDFGAVISFDVPPERLAASLDRLALISVTGSLGATESLIAPTSLFYGADLTLEERQSVHINPGTLRLSVGLEDPEDLQKDLAQAFSF